MDEDSLLLQRLQLCTCVHSVKVRELYTVADHVGEVEGLGDWACVWISLNVQVDPLGRLG